MNTQSVQNEINSIIEANHSKLGKFARRQHQIAKHQIATLTELGILDMVPNAPYSKFIGHSDAAVIIEAAQDAGGKVYVSHSDDVSKSAASNLYALLNTPEPVEDEAIGGGNMDIQVGDYVRVQPHALYRDLHVNASYTPMWTEQHNGYHRARVSRLSSDELGGIIVEVEIGGMFDEVAIGHCEKVG